MLLFPHMQNKIIGFEPNKLVFGKLKNNYYIKNNKRIILHQCGLSDKDDELPLYIPFYRKWMFDGLASLNYESANNWLTNRLWRYRHHLFSIKKVDCEVRKLDDFNFNPYFIKIDVQGHELKVLEGGKNTIEKYRPILLIECVNDQIIHFLNQFNYLFFHYQKGELIKGTGELNTFCMTEEKYIELNSYFDSHLRIDIPGDNKKSFVQEFEFENEKL
jgi:FkbM family methyltransferase